MFRRVTVSAVALDSGMKSYARAMEEYQSGQVQRMDKVELNRQHGKSPLKLSPYDFYLNKRAMSYHKDDLTDNIRHPWFSGISSSILTSINLCMHIYHASLANIFPSGSPLSKPRTIRSPPAQHMCFNPTAPPLQSSQPRFFPSPLQKTHLGQYSQQVTPLIGQRTSRGITCINITQFEIVPTHHPPSIHEEVAQNVSKFLPR